MVGEERRIYPRVKDGVLSLKLNLGDFNTIAHTLDISASGLYCKIDKEIPLMSRVKLILMIPDNSKEAVPSKRLEVDGVVVREHPVIIDGRTKHYDVAIFFDILSEDDRKAISDYISRKAV